MSHLPRLSTFLIIGASVLASCGGGGGSSSTPTAVTTPAPTTPTDQPPVNNNNNAPLAVASSAASVSQGGEFTVSAANSSDPDGETLNFTWIQTAGPNVLPGGTIQATNLTLNAPNVTQDTVLTFEVTASDGTNNSTDTVSIIAQPISAPVTVRPVAPINTDIAVLSGITNEGEDQYRIYWADGFSTAANNIIASQIFSDDGSPIGSQLNGSFDLPQAGSTFSTEIVGLFPASIIETGGTTYASLIHAFQNAVPHLGSLVGPLEGNLSPVGDAFVALGNPIELDQTPIGQNNAINVTTNVTSVDAVINVHILNPDGSVEVVPPAFEETLTAEEAGNPFATVSTVSNPAVSAIGSDGYIVAWRREDTNESPTLRTIDAQIYTSSNELSGQTIEVDPAAGPGFNSTGLDAAIFGNGNSLITWVESQDLAPNFDFIDFEVHARVVSPAGALLSDEFIISESVNDQIATISLPLNNGDILVIWSELGGEVKARLVSSTGSITALGSEFDLAQGVNVASFNGLQTQTGRVIIGYNLQEGNSAITSQVLSFCPVACE